MPDVHSFNILPIDRFSSAGAAIKRPTEITHFSYTANEPLKTGAPSPSNLLKPVADTVESSTAAPAPEHTSHSRVRQLHHDSRGVKYYYPPELGVSLSEGFETFQELQDADDEHLDGLLASLTHLEQRKKNERARQSGVNPTGEEQAEALHMAFSNGTGNRDDDHVWETKADIVTWRGMITKACLKSSSVLLYRAH